MSEYLSQILKSGKTLLTDTKTRPSKDKREAVAKSNANPSAVEETDPHKNFIKKSITEKPSKDDVVSIFKKFITEAESKL